MPNDDAERGPGCFCTLLALTHIQLMQIEHTVGQPLGIDGHRSVIAMTRVAFPDLKVVPEVVVTKSDLVGVVLTTYGT